VSSKLGAKLAENMVVSQAELQPSVCSSLKAPHRLCYLSISIPGWHQMTVPRYHVNEEALSTLTFHWKPIPSCVPVVRLISEKGARQFLIFMLLMLQIQAKGKAEVVEHKREAVLYLILYLLQTSDSVRRCQLLGII